MRSREFITLLGGAATWPPRCQRGRNVSPMATARSADAAYVVGVGRSFPEIDPMAATKRRASLTARTLRVTIAGGHEGRCDAKRSR
jgi:hypothetical protein